MALIEIKRKHLSDRPFKYAAANDIPLFVVDMSPDDSAQPRLHRNERMEFVRWPDLNVFPPRGFDFLSYRLDGMRLACGTDDDGRLEWRIEYEDPNAGSYRVPHPSILASEVTVSCEAIRKEVLRGVFVPEGESPDESIDWYGW